MSDIKQTLEQRGSTYGDFKDHARVTQALKATAEEHGINWNMLKDTHREALEMIFHKIGRILNGDPDYKDNWHDIAGYSKLAEDDCD